MSDSGFQWQVTPEQAFDELFDAYTHTLFLSGARIGAKRAKEVEAWMKQNAPWTDRTGRARAGLRAIAEQDPVRLCSITVTHDPSLSYTVWLEIAYGGKWAIIAKTIDYWGPVLWRDIQNMLNLKLITPGEIGQ